MIEAAVTAGMMVGLADVLLDDGRNEEAAALYHHFADALPDDALADSIRERSRFPPEEVKSAITVDLAGNDAKEGAATFSTLVDRALLAPGVREAPAHLHEAYFLLGCRLEDTAPQRAFRCHRIAVIIQPDYAAAYDHCGRILRRQERIKESAAFFAVTTTLDPGLRDAAVARAFLSSRLGRHTQALAILAGIKAENDDLVRFNEATLLVAHNRLDEALGKASALFFRQPSLQAVHTLLAQLFERLDLPDEAREMAHLDFPALAQTYFERGALDAASGLLRTLHARTGSTPKTLLALAELQLEVPLYLQTEHYLAGIDQTSLDDPSDRILFASLLARLRIRQKAFDEAARILRPHRAMAPRSWLILLPWLELCIATGSEPDEADVAALDRWGLLLGHHVLAQHHVARLLFAFGRIGQAVDLLGGLVARPRWLGSGESVLTSKRWFSAFSAALAVAQAEEDLPAATPRRRDELFRTLDQDHVALHRLRGALQLEKPRPDHGAGGRPRETRIAMSALGHHGRFGNQIFQYAFLKLYAHRHGLTAETPDWAGRCLFEAADDRLAVDDLPPFYDETLAFQAFEGAVPPLLNGRDINGFFMPHMSRYAKQRNAFRALFRPSATVASRIDGAIAKLKGTGERTLVAIHVRRGDFGGDRFWLYPEHFYLAWLERVWPSLRRPVLYVASDDPSIIRNFAMFSPVTEADVAEDIPGAPYFMDHCVMRHADCLAISNSSYSFSACLLNETARLFLRPPAKDLPLVRFDPWNDDVMR